MRTGICLLTAAVLCACGDSPSGPSADVALDFTFGVHRLAFEPAFLVTGGDGDVTIRGSFAAPCTPYLADGDVATATGTLTLTVQGSSPEGCSGEPTAIGYAATIRNVRATDYQVTIVHEWPGTERAPETVFTGDLRVR